jgi:hypothetical protein
MLVGTHWFCNRCGNEYKRPVVSVDRVNELRVALERALELIYELAEQSEYPVEYWLKEAEKLRCLTSPQT